MDYVFAHNNGDSQLPPGFRFHPTDEELITCYLLPKVLDATFACRAIADVDLNKSEPWELPQKAKMGEKEWYFFSLRDRKYPTGLRTNRATKAGYWKVTGKDREIYSSKTSCLIGMKKTLVFYRGRAPKGEKSIWVMHEYRLEGKFAFHFLSKTSKDEEVLARVFQKSTSVGTGTSGSGGGKKRVATGMNSAHTSVASTYILNPDDDYSYNSNTATKQHVPCFSTASAASDFNYQYHSMFDLPPSPLSATSFAKNSIGYPKNVGVSDFPGLGALRENLQLPFFYESAPQPPVHGDVAMCCYGGLSGANPMPTVSPATEKYKAGPTELDCIWRF